MCASFLNQALCVIVKASACVPPDTNDPLKNGALPAISNSVHISVGTVTWHTSAPPPSWILYGHETNSGERNNKGWPPPLPQDPGTWLQSGKHAAEGGWSRREPNVYHEPPTPSDRTSDMQHPAATETGISEVPHEYTHTLRQPLPPQERRGSAALFRCLDKYSLSGNQTGA